MKLKLIDRKLGKKSELGRIRREGNISAALHVHSENSTPVIIDGSVFDAHIRSIPKGSLSTNLFDAEYGGEKFKALVKEIFYDKITYDVLHIDLMKVTDNDVVTVHVPVICKGEDTCLGVTQGGQLKKVKRSVKISVKVSDMPEAFFVDVSNVKLGESIRVRDIELSNSMKLRIDKKIIFIAVSK